MDDGTEKDADACEMERTQSGLTLTWAPPGRALVFGNCTIATTA